MKLKMCNNKNGTVVSSANKFDLYDLAIVSDEQKEYIFKDGEWQPKQEIEVNLNESNGDENE